MKGANLRMRHATDQAAPKKLPGFEAIKKFWDKKHDKYAARILPGEYYVSIDDEMIVTLLGSCVSACIRDRKTGVGGMNHFMLPCDNGAIEQGKKCVSTATRYGTFAMEHMINDILVNGGRKKNLEVKLFGGGRIMASMTDVGARNIEFAKHYLDDEGLRVVSEDLGGTHPRKVLYFPRSGRVLMRNMPISKNDKVTRREIEYQHSIEKAPVSGEIDLF